MDRRSTRIAVFAVMLLGLLALMTVTGLSEKHHRRTEGDDPPEVPGMAVEDAEALLEEGDFEVRVIEEARCGEEPPGTVLYQEPQHFDATTGDEVKLVVSGPGAGPCEYEPF